MTVHGSATKPDVLRLAGVQHAAAVIVAANRDDTAVLVTLSAREIAPKAKIVAAIRESENTHLLRQSGADSVVISSETAGRLLGIATTTPNVVEMIEDRDPEAGFAIAERDVEPGEVGGSPRHLADIVLGVVRDGPVAAHRRPGGRRGRSERQAALHPPGVGPDPPPRHAVKGAGRDPFRICPGTPLLSRTVVDRAEELRSDVDALRAGWAQAGSCASTGAARCR